VSSYTAPILVTAAFLGVALDLTRAGQPLYAIAFVLLAALGVAELFETAAHNGRMRRFGG
jgi:hypothetical protein